MVREAIALPERGGLQLARVGRPPQLEDGRRSTGRQKLRGRRAARASFRGVQGGIGQGLVEDVALGVAEGGERPLAVVLLDQELEPRRQRLGTSPGRWLTTRPTSRPRPAIYSVSGSGRYGQQVSLCGYHQRLELICNLLHESVRIEILIVVFNHPPIHLYAPLLLIGD